MKAFIMLCGVLLVIHILNVCTVEGMVQSTDSRPSSSRQKARAASRGLGGAIAAFYALTRQAGSQPVAVAALEQSVPEVEPPAPSSISASNEPTFMSSLASGAVSRASKEIILHPIDTVRARQQTQQLRADGSGLYRNLYDGLAPALASGVPAGAIFFAVKDTSKKYFQRHGLNKNAATLASVAIANVPYWIVRNPSEILKTQQQVSQVPGNETLLEFFKSAPLEELYRGYSANVGYAYPADAIKFVAYEVILGQYFDGNKPQGLQAAVAGATAGLVAQVTTTPLDVVRTRVMVDEDDPVKVFSDCYRDGSLFKGIRPRALRAVGSGAIQFASYELTQSAFQK
jgi:solute carrier family 25 S-adenosylmethionine transporter 26